MGENSKIEWCDHTVNFWWGCEKVSPACTNCYAESQAKRVGNDIWGRDKPRRFIASAVKDAHKYNREAAKLGVRFKVFTNSMADFFEEDHGQAIVNANGERLCVNWGDDADGRIYPESEAKIAGWGSCHLELTDLRKLAFETIDSTQNLDWLILTKRPENILNLWQSKDMGLGYRINQELAPRTEVALRCDRALHDEIFRRENVWLGTTVENQEQADKRIPELLKCRDLSPVLFLSCEPLLGAVDLRNVQPNKQFEDFYSVLPAVPGEAHGGPEPLDHCISIDWVIAGGESGHNSRPSHPDWFRSLRDQCQAAGVPFFFKQWGEWAPKSHGFPATNNRDWGTIDKIGVWQPLTTPWNGHDDDGETGEAVVVKVGKKVAGRLLDEMEWNEMPDSVASRMG